MVDPKSWSILLVVIAVTSATLQLDVDAAADDRAHNHAHDANHAHVDASAVQPIDCVIALAPERAVDADAARLNTLKSAIGHEGAGPIVLLEQLGWQLLERAQMERDPASLALLNSASGCLAQRDPSSVTARFFDAYVLYTEHQFAAAERILQKVVQSRELALDWALLGDTRLEQGDLGGAAAAYQRLLNLRPGPDGYARMALIREQAGDLEGARAALDLAIRAVGSVRDTKTAWLHAQLARIAQVQGDLSLAERVASVVIDRQPEFAPGWYQAGLVALAANEFELARARLEMAVALEPTPMHQWALIEVLKSTGADAAAESLAQSLVKVGAYYDPRTTALYLANQGDDLGKAKALLSHELGDRRDPITLDAMAWTLHQLGESERAWQFAQLAIAGGTVDARIRLHTSIIARQAGNETAAHENAEVAMAFGHMLYPSERLLLTSS